MEVSRLYESTDPNSEAVQTFHSVFVTSRSEPIYLVDKLEDSKSTSAPPLLRRASCPTALTLSSSSSHCVLSSVGSLHFISTPKDALDASKRDSEEVRVKPERPDATIVPKTAPKADPESPKAVDLSKCTATSRRERIRQSLTRLSESILSTRKLTSGERDACVGTSFISTTVRRHSTGSNTTPVKAHSIVQEEHHISGGRESHSTQSIRPEHMSQTIRQQPSTMSLRRTIRPEEPEGVFSGILSSADSSDEDLLSPVSPIRPMGTLRIHPNQLPVPSKDTAKFSGWFQETPKQSSAFRPSPVGAQLMQVFSHSNPPGPATQQRMWDAFLQKAKVTCIEFADVQDRMPTVVFALRGLLRFADGDYGTTRTDCLAPFIQILTGRHLVCETPACMEAVESVCALLHLLVMHPLGRKIRPKFESVLLAQNCIVLQQIFGILAQQVTKWIDIEHARIPTIPLTNSAVGALLDIVFIHCEHAKLRNAWTVHPSLPKLITNVGEKLPLQIAKCVEILDLLLDAVPPGDHQIVSRQTAQSLHAAIGQVRSSPAAGQALKAIENWATIKGKPSGLSTMFSKTLFGSSKKISLKSAIYAEYKSLI